MILRYYHADYSVPCIENELLFVGTKEECIRYLFKNWSVDYQDNYSDEIQALFCDYLRHIQFADRVFKETTVDGILEHNTDWDCCNWHNINSNALIFNRELIEVIEEPIGADYDIDLYRIPFCEDENWDIEV